MNKSTHIKIEYDGIPVLNIERRPVESIPFLLTVQECLTYIHSTILFPHQQVH